jgi:hypothetical protein
MGLAVRSTDSVRIWLILIHERFGQVPASSSRLKGNLRSAGNGHVNAVLRGQEAWGPSLGDAPI